MDGRYFQEPDAKLELGIPVMLTRIILALSRIWNRLLGRTPPIEQQRGGAGSGLIAYQLNHS
jgi:hypothetical protein